MSSVRESVSSVHTRYEYSSNSLYTLIDVFYGDDTIDIDTKKISCVTDSGLRFLMSCFLDVALSAAAC